MKSALEQFLASARWFGGKGRGFEVGEVREFDLRPDLRVLLVDVTFTGGESATFQLPVVYYPTPHGDLEHAFVGTWNDDRLGDVFVYDALHDHAQTPFVIRSFADEAGYGDLSFHRACDYQLDVEARSAVMSVEQSNTSVAFGEDSLLKVFRRVMPGVNPDIEIHRVLTERGSDNVAQLYGWVELALPASERGSGVVHLAMLQQFLRTASDGWEMALASVRDLIASPDLAVDAAGGDFAAEAERLGTAVGHIHDHLAAAFGTGSVEPGALADALLARLEDHARGITPLAPYVDRLRDRLGAVRDLTAPIPTQRVHGDLHLGQTLRTVKNWKIVDFEGEPAKPLAERVLPDSRWRDVAGMLRSLDYAAGSFDEIDVEEVGHHALSRAGEWALRNRNAFLDGYAETTGADPRAGGSPEATLVTAYELDKAAYEVRYESLNRPDWVHIPLAALERLLS